MQLSSSLPTQSEAIISSNVLRIVPFEAHGIYSRAKTMLENMKISPALLSRFDLVFVLVDDPDARRDQLLSEHVLAVCIHDLMG